MSGFKETCEKYFGTSDFYEILKIEKDASVKDIKKAYHKLSLIVHPDRVNENQKLVATEKFKVLGRIHSVLQDKEKRKIYDESGEYDDEASEGACNWMEYWRKLFKKISVADIQKFEKEYIGSETELVDIKKAYITSKGDMDVMQEYIPFSNIESEPRIIEIVRGMVDRGEVEEYKKFFNEPATKKKRRHLKYQKEKEEAEKDDGSSFEKIANEIQERSTSRFMDLISNIEKKYGGGGKKKKAIAGRETSAKKRKRST